MLRISNHFVSAAAVTLLLVESLVLVGSAYLGVSLRFLDLDVNEAIKRDSMLSSALAFAVVMIASMSAFGMYQIVFRESFRATFLRLMPACVLGFVLMTLVFYVLPDLYMGRGILGFMFMVAVPAILFTRVVFFKSAQTRLLESRILFLGAGALAQECTVLAQDGRLNHKYKIVGYVPTKEPDICVPASALLPSNEPVDDLVKRLNVTEIIVAVQNRRGGGLPIKDLLRCKTIGIKVTDSSAFFEREACQIRVDSLQPSWLVFGTGFDQGFLRTAGKKAFDMVVSITVLIVALPLLVVTALLIFLEDRGPIFYRQERVGKDGKHFMVLKFRSMRVDAERAGTPQWAAKSDPRTTRIGRIIRLLRIDEFPQILNVLKGEMSFVGPRPERPYFVKQLCEEIPYYNVRHSIKPGITGMAQVRYHYGASVADAVQKLQYDLYYVKNNSLFLDLLILIDTLQVVILGKGSR
ncbi:TIGR03013 family XrtA/PEP-CTERM system glycosyltransferase [Noviherbaspirillum denitrificans]|uniref:Exopolysaccharide biosynthesis polyprenyl glycosylphosphotransferase n=1 Tax=Noviherbaspirillum denitrificans TaxID=1968433 RepID=A0A254TCM2_9BURK|nr:TIGR03013 family XrtA/PEP-CTERM system glycosyltransferase [Noviherbaspirillum denitrificans]OWW20399.1 exopolysaccharide biosynthesis polyprenyl glycosylphosphotransferase [Noviherbaspirillum denitrificans]